MKGYELLDSGEGRKLERFGELILDRPAAQAVWQKQKLALWNTAHARFDRKEGYLWQGREKLPAHWVMKAADISMKCQCTDFGHVGVFPETIALWQYIRDHLQQVRGAKPVRFLNLFAYSGGATLAAAQAGAQCTHLDASKGMVDWARENAALNQLQDAPIRWIVDDAIKFLKREVNRGNQYEAVLLDPPSFGRGRKGELYKIEEQMNQTLDLVHQLLSDRARFVILTSHTPGFSPQVLSNLLTDFHADGEHACGELCLKGSGIYPLPNGNWARWTQAGDGDIHA